MSHVRLPSWSTRIVRAVVESARPKPNPKSAMSDPEASRTDSPARATIASTSSRDFAGSISRGGLRPSGDLVVVILERHERLAERARDRGPRRRAEDDAHLALRARHALFEASRVVVRHRPLEHAPVADRRLRGLAEDRMDPQRRLQPLREAKLDVGARDRGALGEEIRRVDADVARLARDCEADVERLDDVALLELRELGVALGGAGCAIGLEHAAVAFVDAAAKHAHRRAPVEIGRARGGVLFDVGRAAHAAHVEEDVANEAVGPHVVALGVREDRGRGARELRRFAILGGEPRGDAVELGRGIVAEREQQRGERVRRVGHLRRGAEEACAERARILRRAFDRAHVAQRALARKELIVCAARERHVVLHERVAEDEPGVRARRAADLADAVELGERGVHLPDVAQRVVAAERRALRAWDLRALVRHALFGRALDRGALDVTEERRAFERRSRALERVVRAIVEPFASCERGLERVEELRLRDLALLALLVEIAERLELRLACALADGGELRVRERGLPRSGRLLEDLVVDGACALCAVDGVEVARGVERASIEEEELRRRSVVLRAHGEHALGRVRVAGRE